MSPFGDFSRASVSTGRNLFHDRPARAICVEYLLRRSRMSASMATTVKAQYAPHRALMVMLSQTRQRNGMTGRTIAAVIS